jgi:hypothetical protein
MTTTCDQIKELLIDNTTELSPEMHSHILGCPTCLALQSQMAELDSCFDAFLQLEPPSVLIQQIENDISREFNNGLPRRKSPKIISLNLGSWFFGNKILVSGFVTACLSMLVIKSVMLLGSKASTSFKTIGSALSAPAEAGKPAYEDLIVSLQGEVNDMNTNLRDNLNVSDRFKDELEQQKEKTEGVIDMMVERMEAMDEKLKDMEAATQHLGQSATINASDQLSSFGWEAKPRLPPPSPPTIGSKRFISPGDSIPLKLLTGVAAPTDGTPYPVVFKLDGTINGPNGEKLDFGEARIIATAVASETDSRVIYRLHGLVRKDSQGQRFSHKIDGWVVGEDGQRGMSGQIVDKLGQVIASTAGYSFVAALGNNFIRQNNTKDHLATTYASALTDASNRLGQMLVDKYEKLIPVVEVKAGREVAAVFSIGTEIDTSASATSPITSWEQFLKTRESIEGLVYQSPTGYWSNTYLPGSQKMRELQLQINKSLTNASPELATLLKSILEQAQKPLQPIDNPSSSAGALNIELSADTKMIKKEKRLLLQVNIRVADRLNSTRQAINEQIIVDLRDKLSAEEQERLREILTTFEKTRKANDQISIKFLTPNGIKNIAANELRYGTLAVMLQDVFSTLTIPTQGTTSANQSVMSYNISSILKDTILNLTANNKASDHFSSPGIVIIGSDALKNESSDLTALAFRSSQAGIPVSIFGIRNNSAVDESNQLAIAGKGRAQIITDSQSAISAVKNEFISLGKVVAQGLRLNIKLEPGVKLVNVVGASKLEGKSVSELKQAESEIDSRLSKALSIAADRGRDDDGIQLFIPSFYAGDTHTILLDVVAANSGKVAEVTGKFKDLIQIKNNTSKNALTLQPGEADRTQAEWSVIQNLLTQNLSEELKQISQLIKVGNTKEAEVRLKAQLELFNSLNQSASTINHSPETHSSLQIIQDSLAALNFSNGQNISLLPETLQLAALKRTNCELCNN